MWYCPIPTPRLIALPVQVTAPRDSNDTQVNGGTITLASSNSSISAVCPGHHTLTGTPRFQREPLTDVLNCFGAFPLICFFRVCVCVCVCIDDLKSGRGGGRDAVIRSGPLTSLCADKAGHTLTHTHSPAMPRHQRLITHLCVITLWLLSPATTPYSFWDFFFLFYGSGGGLQQGGSISKCLQEIRRVLYSDERFHSKTRFPSTVKSQSHRLQISQAENEDDGVFQRTQTLFCN